MIGLYCCNLPPPPPAPIDSLRFLPHCAVGNGDTEERGGKRIMKEGEKFGSAEVACELTVCQFSTSLPVNLPSTN